MGFDKFCPKCEKIKPTHAFSKNKNRKDGLGGYCKSCVRGYANDRYSEIRKFCIEHLGGKCVSCDTIENLQFDHIDPKTKNFSIGKMLNFSVEELEYELYLCQLLCEGCHKEKTRENKEITGRPRK